MAVTSGFFNGLNHDRRYNTEQLSRLFDGIIKDGIFSSIGTGLVVKAGTGNTVNVGIGKCWFNHVWVENDAIQPIDCDLSEVVLGRIDAIVIDIDHTETVRKGDIIYVKGTAASTPVKPTMISETNHHQYPLCFITRTANSSAITQADIENKVGSDETPFVTGILETISLDQLLTQWSDTLDQFVASEEADFTLWSETEKASFVAWFEEIINQLSTDQAGNLQLQINKNEIERLLMTGLIDGQKTFSDDGTIISSVDSTGRTLIKTFSNGFLTSTSVLKNSSGSTIASMVKNFSTDGKVINTTVIIN